jgi:hypothetical protein
MLWTIFAILLVLWLLGWGFHVAGGLIHVLLIAAGIVLVINLVFGDRVGGEGSNPTVDEKQGRH